MSKRSGLQQQVLGLYRQFLRALHHKPQATQQSLYPLIRQEFDKHRSIPLKDFDLIEYHLRAGRRKLSVVAAEGTVGATALHFSGAPK